MTPDRVKEEIGYSKHLSLLFVAFFIPLTGFIVDRFDELTLMAKFILISSDCIFALLIAVFNVYIKKLIKRL